MHESAFTPFLRAIHDRPGDDLPRLIFADYLDERGDWRGPLMRRPAPDDIVRDHEATQTWRRWLGKLPRNSWVSCRQGLLDVILPAAGAFELPDSHRLKEVLREGWVAHLDITDNEGMMPWAEQLDLVELPALGVQRADEETLERLPVMPELRRLYLNDCHASRGELANLCEFPKLDYVHISLTDANLDDLRRAAAVPKLKSLSVRFGDRLLPSLEPIREMKELRRLHVGPGFSRVEAVFDVFSNLTDLEYLRLDELPSLFNWPDFANWCPRLKRMRLSFSVPGFVLVNLRRVRPDLQLVVLDLSGFDND